MKHMADTREAWQHPTAESKLKDRPLPGKAYWQD